MPDRRSRRTLAASSHRIRSSSSPRKSRKVMFLSNNGWSEGKLYVRNASMSRSSSPRTSHSPAEASLSPSLSRSDLTSELKREDVTGFPGEDDRAPGSRLHGKPPVSPTHPASRTFVLPESFFPNRTFTVERSKVA